MGTDCGQECESKPRNGGAVYVVGRADQRGTGTGVGGRS